MNPLSEAAWTARLMLRPALVWATILVGVAAAVVAAVAAFFYWPVASQIDKAQNAPAQNVSTQAYVASLTGLIDCVAVGPAGCGSYAKAAQTLPEVLPAEGMKYTALDGSTATFRWKKGDSTQAVKKVSDAIGAAANVTPGNVKVDAKDSRAGTYQATVKGEGTSFTMSLAVGDQTVKIRSVLRVP